MRKDLATRNQRSFSLEFKRRVVEELMSGERRPAQLCRRYNIISNVIYRSDQGVQYASGDYVDKLKSRGFEISMAPGRQPLRERHDGEFFTTLKYEVMYLCEYETLEDMVARLPYFIDEVYNQKRLHSALGCRSPNDFSRD